MTGSVFFLVYEKLFGDLIEKKNEVLYHGTFLGITEGFHWRPQEDISLHYSIINNPFQCICRGEEKLLRHLSKIC